MHPGELSPMWIVLIIVAGLIVWKAVRRKR